MKNTVCTRINAAFRLVVQVSRANAVRMDSSPLKGRERTSMRLPWLIALLLFSASMVKPFPAYAGLAEGLSAYDRADYATALKELAPLAEKGDAAAQYRMGKMTSLGQGAARDARSAAEWFHKAAQQGLAEAQSALGYLCLIGEGVSQNNDLALAWTRKAAEQGDARAQFNLAVMHGDSYGIKKNPAESLKWMRKAAEQGQKDALIGLARMYQEGKGVSRDSVLAFMMFELAGRNGHTDAFKGRHAVAGKMSPTQVQEAGSLANAWKKGMPLPVRSKTGAKKSS